MQTGPLLSPNLYRKYIKPRTMKICGFIRDNTKAKIFYHCCGSVIQFMQDFIDLGFDILNPVQTTATGMDPNNLKKMWGDKICFHGGIDTQKILPFGTPNEVENEVVRLIRSLAPGGGYILAPCHNIQPNTPPENVIRMFEVANKYGTYPLEI
jgi:uroporphyrinogen decarboxylase